MSRRLEKVSFLSTLNPAELTGGVSITGGRVNLRRGAALRRSQSRDALTSELWIHLSLTQLVSLCGAERTRYWLATQTDPERPPGRFPDAPEPVGLVPRAPGPRSRTQAGSRQSYWGVVLLEKLPQRVRQLLRPLRPDQSAAVQRPPAHVLQGRERSQEGSPQLQGDLLSAGVD